MSSLTRALDPEPPAPAAKHRHVVAYLLVPLLVMAWPREPAI